MPFGFVHTWWYHLNSVASKLYYHSNPFKSIQMVLDGPLIHQLEVSKQIILWFLQGQITCIFVVVRNFKENLLFMDCTGLWWEISKEKLYFVISSRTDYMYICCGEKFQRKSFIYGLYRFVVWHFKGKCYYAKWMLMALHVHFELSRFFLKGKVRQKKQATYMYINTL